MNIISLIQSEPDRKRYVELTESGPVLFQSDIDASSTNTISTHEIDEATFTELMAILQTGELDNATVESIIEVKK